MKLKIEKIGEIVKGKIFPPTTSSIQGVVFHSKEVFPGSLFVAIKGEKKDGHSFVKEAKEKGAVCAMVSEEREYPLPVIKVKDTVWALGELAKWYRGRIKIPIIGISGSNGKTTTKEIIAESLGVKYNVYKSEKSYNSLTGLPISLLKISEENEIGVMEVGINKKGEMKRLEEILSPEIVVLTNIGETHLESFRSEGGVFSEKKKLLRKAKLKILNKDDKWLRRIKNNQIKWYGIKEGDIKAEEVEVKEEGVEFKVKGVHFSVPLIGRYQVYNILPGIVLGLQFGISLKDISERLKNFRKLEHRDKVITVRGIKIIDSSYNANPSSMRVALEELSRYKGRKVAILGDMLELGKEGVRCHKEIGKLLGELGIDVVISYGKLAKWYLNYKRGEKIYLEKLEIKKIKEIITEGDIVLIKGSRKMNMERIVKELEER
jgi:UDP-N-acetylmuramoyl-tripeptide--D-alanyl-D-alanine ligase